jgi:CRP-like cAMP-binding protein
MKQSDCITCNNTTCLFKNSSTENLKQFSYERGQQIFLKDMLVKGLYIVHNGLVEEFYVNPKKNKKIITQTVIDGEIFGHTDYSGTKHALNAIAAKNTQVCFIDKDSLYKTCQKNSEWTHKLMVFFLDQLNKSYNKRI